MSVTPRLAVRSDAPADGSTFADGRLASHLGLLQIWYALPFSFGLLCFLFIAPIISQFWFLFSSCVLPRFSWRPVCVVRVIAFVGGAFGLRPSSRSKLRFPLY
ncbi:hypothetical protein U1Q18_000935 [Sarracenia purpurea var. burkii]